MEPIKYVSLMLILFLLIIGCSGTNGKLKTQSESDSKVTQKKLIDNWSDYNIWLGDVRNFLAFIVFDPKNDNRKIVVKSHWKTIKDQKTWTEFVKANTTSDGDFSLGPDGLGNTAIRVSEIWGPDNQLYGYVFYLESWWIYVRLVDENTLRLEGGERGGGGAP